MKKAIALVLSLMMVVLCVTAFAEASEEVTEDVETSVESKTEPMTIDPALVLGDWYGETDGVVINIRLNEDGTAQCFVGEAEVNVELIWTLNGNIVTVVTKDGTDPLSGPYMAEDDTLPLASEDGMQVLFTREKIEAASTVTGVDATNEGAAEEETEEPEKDAENSESEIGSLAAAAAQGALAGVVDAADAVAEVVSSEEGQESLMKDSEKNAEAALKDVEVEVENVEADATEAEAIPEEDVNETFFHDPEGWMLDNDRSLTPELTEIFEHAMAAETRFNVQPILHLGTKINVDFTEHCYLAVISSLEDPDNAALFLIYIDEPEEADPVFYAGLELMLTLSPYEEATAEDAE